MKHTDLVPPQALEFEDIVCGSIMMEKDSIETVLEHINEKSFYNPQNALIFKAAHQLHREGVPIDMLTVGNRLKENGDFEKAGGFVYISNLTSRLGSTANIEFHSLVIKEKAIARELIRINSESIRKLYEPTNDPLETLMDIQQSVEKLVSHKSTDISISSVYDAAEETIENASKSNTGLSGITTGYNSIDAFTGGFNKGELMVIAALPATFKSAFALSCIWKAALRGVPTHMFQLEMERSQVGIRIISAETGIDIERLKTGRLTNHEKLHIQSVRERIKNAPITIDFTSGITVSQLVNSAAKVVREKGVEVIVVDYLQLMDLEEKQYSSTEAALDSAIRRLKVAAKKLGITIVILASFTREGNKEHSKPPTNNFLKGTQGFEAHADTIILLWCPSKHIPNFEYENYNGEIINTSEKLGLVFSKNRQGRIGLLWLKLNASCNTFRDLDDIGNPIDGGMKPNDEF